jgi:hypothetical protein
MEEKKDSKDKKDPKSIWKTILDYLNAAKDILLEFTATVFIYGLALSFAFSFFLPNFFQINISSVLAFGISFYFIKEEVPRIISKTRYRG